MGYLVASLVCAILACVLVIRRRHICNRIEIITPALCSLTLSLYFAIFALGWLGLLVDFLFVVLGCALISLAPVVNLTSRYLPNNEEG